MANYLKNTFEYQYLEEHKEKTKKLTPQEQLKAYKQNLKVALEDETNILNKGFIYVKDIKKYSIYNETSYLTWLPSITNINKEYQRTESEADSIAKAKGFIFKLYFSIDSIDDIKTIKDKPTKKIMNLVTGKEPKSVINYNDYVFLKLPMTNLESFKNLIVSFHLNDYFTEDGIKELKSIYDILSPNEINLYLSDILAHLNTLKKEESIQSFNEYIKFRVSHTQKYLDILKNNVHDLKKEINNLKEILSFTDSDLDNLIKTNETFKLFSGYYVYSNHSAEDETIKDLICQAENNKNSTNYLCLKLAQYTVIKETIIFNEVIVKKNEIVLQEPKATDRIKKQYFDRLIPFIIRESSTELISSDSVSIHNNNLTLFLQTGIGLNISNVGKTSTHLKSKYENVRNEIINLEEQKKDVKILDDEDKEDEINYKLSVARDNLLKLNIIKIVPLNYKAMYEDKEKKKDEFKKKYGNNKTCFYVKNAIDKLIKSGKYDILYIYNQSSTNIIDMGDYVTLRSPIYKGFEAQIQKYNFVDYYQRINFISNIISHILTHLSNSSTNTIEITEEDLNDIYKGDSDRKNLFTRDILTIASMKFSYEKLDTKNTSSLSLTDFISSYDIDQNKREITISDKIYQIVHFYNQLTYLDKNYSDLSLPGRQVNFYLTNLAGMAYTQSRGKNLIQRVKKDTLRNNISYLPTPERVKALGDKHINHKVYEPLENAIEENSEFIHFSEEENSDILAYALKDRISESEFNQEIKKQNKEIKSSIKKVGSK